MPKVNLNAIQRFRLYQFMERQGKGAGHMRRMQRLFLALDIEPVEQVLEKNEETIGEFSAEGKAVPKSALTVLRASDPPVEYELSEEDLNKVYDRLQLLKKDSDADSVKGIKGEEHQDWRVWLPIISVFV